MTALAFDAVVAAVLLLAAWRGYRTGFILTLCGFLAVFVAFIGATMISNTLSAPVSRIIQPAVEHNIQQIFLQHLPSETESPDVSVGGETDPDLPFRPDGSSDPNQPADTVEISLPEALKLLKESPAYKGFAAAFQKALNDGMVSATVNAARSIADYVSKQVARLALFLVSFVLIMVLWFFLSHALDLAFRLPVLFTLNHWSGAVLGLLKGTLLLFIVCWLLKGSFLPSDIVRETRLLRFFCTVSPLALVF